MPKLRAPLKSIAPTKRQQRPTPTIAARPTAGVTPVAPTTVRANERAHHEDFAVGEVDQLDDAVDEGVAERDQGDQRAVGHPDDQELGEERQLKSIADSQRRRSTVAGAARRAPA